MPRRVGAQDVPDLVQETYLRLVRHKADDPITLPVYMVFSAMTMYRFPANLVPWVKNLTAQVNVNNIFNTTYYTTSYDRSSAVPGQSRTVLVSLRAEF